MSKHTIYRCLLYSRVELHIYSLGAYHLSLHTCSIQSITCFTSKQISKRQHSDFDEHKNSPYATGHLGSVSLKIKTKMFCYLKSLVVRISYKANNESEATKNFN